MKFFIALVILIITGSCYVFGIGETFYQIYVENAFWSYSLTILIIAYMFISRNKNNYGGQNDTFSY